MKLIQNYKNYIEKNGGVIISTNKLKLNWTYDLMQVFYLRQFLGFNFFYDKKL